MAWPSRVWCKMTDKPLQHFAPGSAELELMLQAGYPDMTRAKAERIIAERAKRPELWPYEQLQRAEAFLAALFTAPTVVSTKVPKDLQSHEPGAPDVWRAPSRSPNR